MHAKMRFLSLNSLFFSNPFKTFIQNIHREILATKNEINLFYNSNSISTKTCFKHLEHFKLKVFNKRIFTKMELNFGQHTNMKNL